jgi:hypothetical protein
MDNFVNDIFGVYELINNTDIQAKTFIDTKLISKQYLTYYLYRIFCKYTNIFENSIPSSQINNLLKILRIPKENQYENTCYPLAGKLTNDEKFLDMIILTILDMLTKIGKYIATLPNKTSYGDFLEFLAQKKLNIIVQDLVDLQKLIPGLSVPAIRPDYDDDDFILTSTKK